MKLPIILASEGIGVQPQPQASPRAFSAGYGELAQAGEALAKFGAEVGKVRAEQEKAASELELDSTINRLKLDYATAQQSALDSGADPTKYAQTMRQTFDQLATMHEKALQYPGSKQLWQRKVEALRTERAITAQAEGIKLAHAQIVAQAGVQDKEDANDAVFAPTPQERADAYNRALTRTQGFIKRGIYSGEQGAAKITGFLQDVETATILNDANDPSKVPGLIQSITTGAFKHIAPDTGLKLVESVLNRQEHLVNLVHKQFEEASGELRKDYTARIRQAQNPADFAVIERDLLDAKDRFTKADFTEILGYNDTLKKARTQGESDEATFTDLVFKIDSGELTTLNQLRPYADRIAQKDMRTLADKVADKKESARKEAKSDAERRANEARTAGEKYIRDATTISSNLLNFDQVAKQVQASQAYSFATETNGLTDPGQINRLAQERVAQARAALADKLSFEGAKLYPLAKYKTPAEVVAAYQRGDFGVTGSYEARTKSDNMIHLLEFIEKLTTQSGERALTTLSTTAAEQGGQGAKPRPLQKFFGAKEPLNATPQDFSGPVQDAAKELYPGMSLSEIANDEAKVKAITERATQKLRKKRGKK